MKKVFVFSLVFFLACYSCQSEKKQGSFVVNKSIVDQNALDYTLCSCLGEELNLSDSLLVEDGSAAGYLNSSYSDVELFNKLDSIVKIYLDTAKYGSKFNRKLHFKKCIDFYNSKELRDYINSQTH